MSCSQSGCVSHFTKKRYIVFLLATLVGLALPFVTINEKHFFLLSFDKLQLHLLFTSYNIQEFHVMPFVLMLLFIGIFFMTTLGGRVWCGWLCPQTIFRTIYRDLIQTKLLKIHKRVENKQHKKGFDQPFKRVLAFLIWCLLSLLAASNLAWYSVPPEDFFTYMSNPAEHTVLLGFVLCMTGFLIYLITTLKEDFCIYVCPYVRIQSTMCDEDTLQVLYSEQRGGVIFKDGVKQWSKPPEGDCTGCEACVRVCPTHIDIRKGIQLECIGCLECVDACSKVMEKLDKPSLISWISPTAQKQNTKTNFFRMKTFGYIAVLCVVFTMMVLMSGNTEQMKLNINRTTELFKINDGAVENSYIFMFENTDNEDHEYYFEVLNPGIAIKRPKESFVVEKGQKAKKVVILSSHVGQKGNVEITIRAYAKDKPIEVLRKSVFIYPN